jgi:hypothetical protein
MKIECPRCGGKELYEIDQVCFEEDSINGVRPFAFFAHYGLYGEMGWMGEKNKRLAVNASARICGTCGHADLFTKDLDVLRRLVEKRAPGLRKL